MCSFIKGGEYDFYCSLRLDSEPRCSDSGTGADEKINEICALELVRVSGVEKLDRHSLK